MATNLLIPFITPEEYLEHERDAEFRSEYLSGVIYEMQGATEKHSRIAMNLGAELSFAIRSKGCEVYSQSLAVHIPNPLSYVYPDVMVICGKPVFSDAFKDSVTNPVLVIEIISPSTEGRDRGEKFRRYRRIPTLQEYVLVSPQEPLVERYQREQDTFSRVDMIEGWDATLNLASLGLSIPLAVIYRGHEIV